MSKAHEPTDPFPNWYYPNQGLLTLCPTIDTPSLIPPSSVNRLSYCSFPPRSLCPLWPTLSSSPLWPLIPLLNLPLNCWICIDLLSLSLISHSLLIYMRNIVQRAKGKLQIVQVPNRASNKSISI